ncbi:MAG: DUF4258 domain-containing protein [SAR202 cluster bacterium]|nr:DUF4258 domain-containing protein [SAR202 cluster bacterium]
MRRIRPIPRANLYYWSRHAIVELVNETLNHESIESGFLTCEMIEDYPAGPRALPDYLVLGTSSSGEIFHAVLAIYNSNERLLVVTVYAPTAEESQDGWRIRRP